MLLVCSAALLSAAELENVRSVYVMPMSRGLDQYLAARIAHDHIFQIVTDPKLADAVLTERVGEALQVQLENISPTPKPPEPEKPAEPEPVAKTEKGPKRPKNLEPVPTSPLFGETVNKLESPAQSSSFGRGKGNIFLVDIKSRQVVWSTFDPPRGTELRDLDRTAIDIVSRLKKDLTPKK
jgi:hypothetical protein